MVLYIIGLGLGDEKDITVRGLEAIKKCDKIFLESYTSILRVNKEKLEEFYDKPIIIADRYKVESEAEELILGPCVANVDTHVALLVVGDPVCATTHTDLMLRAQQMGIQVELIHNASAMGAVGCCGLQLYNFGRTVSIPFFEDSWKPTSFYTKIAYNKRGGMHTLCLLDIKVKEPDFEQMAKGRTVFLPPRYMSVSTAARQLLEAEEEYKQGICSEDTLAIGLARLGQSDQYIAVGTLLELTEVDFGEPLHSLIVCGDDIHDLEWDMLQQFLLPNTKVQQPTTNTTNLNGPQQEDNNNILTENDNNDDDDDGNSR